MNDLNVLLINGSPHKNGCTDTALELVAEELEAAGVATEIVWIGNKVDGGCMGCGYCSGAGNGRCVKKDIVNDLLPKLEAADGLVIGAPVHYAGAAANACAVMDRLFYANKTDLRMKVGAAVVSCRRGGNESTFQRLNQYFTISQMPIASSRYWNDVHGRTREDVLADEEGVYTMRTLGRNMAFLVKAIALGREQLGLPEQVPPVMTNFIR